MCLKTTNPKYNVDPVTLETVPECIQLLYVARRTLLVMLFKSHSTLPPHQLIIYQHKNFETTTPTERSPNFNQ